jgi:hypothetical protein
MGLFSASWICCSVTLFIPGISQTWPPRSSSTSLVHLVWLLEVSTQMSAHISHSQDVARHAITTERLWCCHDPFSLSSKIDLFPWQLSYTLKNTALPPPSLVKAAPVMPTETHCILLSFCLESPCSWLTPQLILLQTWRFAYKLANSIHGFSFHITSSSLHVTRCSWLWELQVLIPSLEEIRVSNWLPTPARGHFLVGFHAVKGS